MDEVYLEKFPELKHKVQHFIDHAGLTLAFVYHCNRCNYSWLPKDADVFKNILNLPPPKVCARCKTKYWNKPRIRNRELKLPPNIKNDGMLSLPRIKAMVRQSKRRMARMQEIKKQFDSLNAEYGQVQVQDKTPIPVATITTNKKKKKKLKL